MGHHPVVAGPIADNPPPMILGMTTGRAIPQRGLAEPKPRGEVDPSEILSEE